MGTIAHFPGPLKPINRPPAPFVDEADIDTIEMELRPDDLARLTALAELHARAANPDRRVEPDPIPEPPRPVAPVALVVPTKPSDPPVAPPLADPAFSAEPLATNPAPPARAPSANPAFAPRPATALISQGRESSAAPTPARAVVARTVVEWAPPLTVAVYEPTAAAPEPAARGKSALGKASSAKASLSKAPLSKASLGKSALSAVAESVHRAPWPIVLLGALLAVAMLAGLSAGSIPQPATDTPPAAPAVTSKITQAAASPTEGAPPTAQTASTQVSGTRSASAWGQATARRSASTQTPGTRSAFAPLPRPASAQAPRSASAQAPGSASAQAHSPESASGLASAPDAVTFRNPFDRAEVFEFPPGTSRDEARDAVAQILMDRARERRTR